MGSKDRAMTALAECSGSLFNGQLALRRGYQ